METGTLRHVSWLRESRAATVRLLTISRLDRSQPMLTVVKIYHDRGLVDFLSFLLFIVATILPIFARSNSPLCHPNASSPFVFSFRESPIINSNVKSRGVTFRIYFTFCLFRIFGISSVDVASFLLLAIMCYLHFTSNDDVLLEMSK